jgi:outer membrane receptor protein involved in Fe transport
MLYFCRKRLLGEPMRIKSNNRFLTIFLATMTIAIAPAPGIVAAQVALEEIVVTATKREKSTQDIPISINTISGDAIEEKSIHDMSELSASVGNLFVGQGLTADVITMRGLGTGQDRSFEQSVGMFIDGQYLPRSRQYQAPFFDMERIEVVRGPQAVLFGLNSSAGAINITTRKNRPGDELEARILASYETEYEGKTIEGALGGSLSENFSARVAGRFRDTDGYYTNLATGQSEGDTEESLVRLSAVWELTDAVSVTGKYEHSDYQVFGSTGESYGPAAGAVEPTDGVLNWVRTADATTVNPFGVFSSDRTQQSGKLTNAQLGLDWQLNSGTLSFLYGYSDFEYTLLIDLDTTGLPIIEAGIDPELYEQNSFEVRYATSGDGPVQFLGGLYWHDTELSNVQNNVITNAGLLPVIGTPTWEATGIFGQDSDLLSVYGSVDWALSDRTALNFGARYTDEDKSTLRDSRCGGLFPTAPMFVPIPGLPNCPPAALDGFTASRNSTNFMPEVSIQFDLSDNVMLYGKFGQSAKSGGFNSNTNSQPDNIEYDDEKSQGFEVGLKSTLADGRVRLNATLFQNQFDDLQVSTAQVTTDMSGSVVVIPVIANVADSTSQGLEVEFQWAATDWLELGMSGALLDTEYDSFPNATCNTGNAGSADPITGLCDLSGQRLPLAAEYSGNLYADVNVPIGNTLNFIGGVDIGFSDAYFTDPTLEPTAKQDSWTTIDARVGVGSQDNKWTVSLVGRNLGDEVVLNFSQPFVTTIGYIRPPMTLAVQGTYRFGQ